MFLSALASPAGATAAPGEQDPLAWDRYQNTPDDPIASVDWFTPTVEIATGEGARLPVAGDGERTLNDTSLNTAQRYAESLNSYALIIAHRGVIQREFYEEGFGTDRLLDSQSLHKPLAAMLTMAAVADGLLSLDDPMADFIAAWREDPRGRITVRDVLYMQTGLSQPRYEDRWDNAALRLFITSRVEDALLALPAESPPGEYFRSHFAATQLLQLVLESVTGKRYADYLRERLWQPLEGGEARVRLDRPGGNAQIFCCLQARPRGWLRVGLMLSRHGEYAGKTVLPFDAFMQLTTPSQYNPNFAMSQIWRGSPYQPLRIMDSRNPRFGLPVSAPFAAEDVFFLESRGGQRVYVVPSRELVVVRQGEIRMEWDDAAFLNPLIEAAGSDEEKGAFSALLAPPAPDYRRADSWARHPGSANDPSRAAAFYVNPTTYRGSELWNAPHNAPDVNPGVDEVVLGQASVLDACCDVWAPRYRQASFGALGGGLQAYDLAFLDVRAAFAQFLDEIGDRPFIILGHSQGALHTQRLVARIVDPDPDLAQRLIAAYVIGIAVPEALYAQELARITPCTEPAQVGCIASWATFAEDYKGLKQWRESTRERYARMMDAAGSDAIQCTNPLSWRADEAAVPPAANLGATMVNADKTELIAPVPELVGTRCADGALLISRRAPEPFTTLEFMPGNYHFADVALFHENISRNLAERAAAWRAQRSSGF